MMNVPVIDEEFIWVTIGLLGQSMFFMRFFFQWLSSERAKKSVIPYCFWYFSIAGSIILLAYGLWRKDPVIILGQTVGFFIYFRNLYLIHRSPKETTSDIVNL